MHSAIFGTYRILFIMGGFLAFISYFIDWYGMIVVNELGQVVLECVYHPFLEWKILDYIYFGALHDFYPSARLIPLEFVIFDVGIIIISLFITLFKKNPTSQESQRSKYHGYFLLLTTLMRLVIISYFTFRLYLEEGMHVPVLIVENEQFEVIMHQNIEFGYIFHAFSFLLFFPLAWFQIKFNSQFEIIKDQQNIQSLNKGELNLDQLIAEERVQRQSQRHINFAQVENNMEIIQSRIPPKRGEQ